MKKNSKIPLACPNKFNEIGLQQNYKRPLVRFTPYDMMPECSREAHSHTETEYRKSQAHTATREMVRLDQMARRPHTPQPETEAAEAARRRVLVSLDGLLDPISSRRGRRDPLAGAGSAGPHVVRVPPSLHPMMRKRQGGERECSTPLPQSHDPVQRNAGSRSADQTPRGQAAPAGRPGLCSSEALPR